MMWLQHTQALLSLTEEQTSCLKDLVFCPKGEILKFCKTPKPSGRHSSTVVKHFSDSVRHYAGMEDCKGISVDEPSYKTVLSIVLRVHTFLQDLFFSDKTDSFFLNILTQISLCVVVWKCCATEKIQQLIKKSD